MAEPNAFKSGSATPDNTQNKPGKDLVARKDEYGGNYRPIEKSVSEAEKYWTTDNPTVDIPLPAKGLKSVGG